MINNCGWCHEKIMPSQKSVRLRSPWAPGEMHESCAAEFQPAQHLRPWEPGTTLYRIQSIGDLGPLEFRYLSRKEGRAVVRFRDTNRVRTMAFDVSELRSAELWEEQFEGVQMFDECQNCSLEYSRMTFSQSLWATKTQKFCNHCIRYVKGISPDTLLK